MIEFFCVRVKGKEQGIAQPSAFLASIARHHSDPQLTEQNARALIPLLTQPVKQAAAYCSGHFEGHSGNFEGHRFDFQVAPLHPLQRNLNLC